ncbi:hypothetical protein GCM10009128_13830 [Psychrosphaera haliotis]|uniref:flagellar basal body P-ring formation chaperone FlgA n=1 Tax=Psychrosphaera haliotis TaxID=555083 RepID=UPI0031DFC814
MLKNLLIILLFNITLNFVVFPVSAKSANSLAHDALLKQVSEFVQGQVNPNNTPNITVKAMPLDSRIRISHCQSELQFDMPSRQRFTRHFPIKASCFDEGASWKAYVQVRVYEYIETIVTTTHIAKGEVISSDMIETALVDRNKVRAKSTDSMSNIVGGRAMRNITRGFQVSGSDVCLVCKGDSVAIIADYNNLTIKTSGTALENGSFGQSIQVQNNSSERIVKGVIGDLRQIFIKL